VKTLLSMNKFYTEYSDFIFLFEIWVKHNI
jgi:hypothetical protein